IRRSRLELLLKVLDVDGAVRRERGGWSSTGEPWVYDAERYERIAEARRVEQRDMLDYATTTTCRMAYLQHRLDDDTAAPCGRCDNCAGPWLTADVGDDAAASASAAVDRVGVEIEPRRQWPSGLDRLGVPLTGRIHADEQASPGRALARLTDLGWGGPLRELFAPDAPDQPVPERMVAGCVRVLADWGWEARPVAVAAMPSRSRPTLAASLAGEIARIGRLPMLGALELDREAAPGRPGGNSAFRVADLSGAFSTSSLDVPAGPVLLVDDIADSRWTLTLAARELRRAGATAVLPFTLALRA
ncbi:MAG: RecQ family zinc-binding domain-containing protein, partial [Pseudoclavibacter sp.]